jgi:hypothetical protein
MKCKVSDLNIYKKSLKRAGIVLFAKYKKSIWFGMGIDRMSGDISDFGGHRMKKDSDILETAIREFEEETLGVCGKIKKENIKNCYSVHDNNIVVIFYPTEINIKESINIFKNTVSGNTEMSGLIWIKQEKLKRILSDTEVEGPKIYSKIKKLLYKDQILNELKI